MSRTTRRTLAFDAMEGRVLLSAGMADPAKVVHLAALAHRSRARVPRFLLNGTLRGIPFGTVGPDGINVESFTLVGKAQSMGKVAGSLALTNTTISPGKKPDLSNATLIVSNLQGWRRAQDGRVAIEPVCLHRDVRVGRLRVGARIGDGGHHL